LSSAVQSALYLALTDAKQYADLVLLVEDIALIEAVLFVANQ